MQSPNSSRVTRSSLTTFNEKLCLFCQEKGNEEVHEIMQDSKDTILKQAFKECPVTLETFKIRSEKALDARAGDLNYHATCWNKYINRRVPDFPSEENLELLEAMPDSFNDTLAIEEEPSTSTASTISKTSRACVMADMIEGIEQALAQGKILTVKDVVHVYETRINEMGRSDERTYSSKQKWVKKHIEKNVSNIKFESTLGNNSSQRIISTGLNSLMFTLMTQTFLFC